MSVRCLWFCLVVASLTTVGCGPPQAEFVLSERTTELTEGAQRAVENALEEQFGTPHDLVAWLRLPVNYGGYAGTVADPAAGEAPNVFSVSFDPPVDQLEAGQKLVWMGGTMTEAVANRDDEEEPIQWTVASYNGETRLLTVEAADVPVERWPVELKPAAGDPIIVAPGSTMRHGRRLYMEHCMHCHGVSGDGDGPTARYLNPLPRDYRQGVFKFTSTAGFPLQVKVRRDDLKNTIRQGIPGTYMPSFLLLQDDELDAIVEYIRWLAMRGEFEQKLVDTMTINYSKQAVTDRLEGGESAQEIRDDLNQYISESLPLDIDRAGDELRDDWTAPSEPDNVVTPAEPRSNVVEGLAEWLRSSAGVLRLGQVEAPPVEHAPAVLSVQLAGEGEVAAESDLLWLSGPLQGTLSKVSAFDGTAGSLMLAEAPAEAQALGGARFAVGGGLPPVLAYVVRHNADVNALIEMARDGGDQPHQTGALEERLLADSVGRGRMLYFSRDIDCAKCHGPQGRGNGLETYKPAPIPGSDLFYDEPGLRDAWGHVVEPRDLTAGIYRGGRRPIDIYRRIAAGIKGTPMPAFANNLREEGQRWDLVNFVLQVPYMREPISPPEGMPSAAEPPPQQTAARGASQRRESG